jgi:hypothetical protein
MPAGFWEFESDRSVVEIVHGAAPDGTVHDCKILIHTKAPDSAQE